MVEARRQEAPTVGTERHRCQRVSVPGEDGRLPATQRWTRASSPTAVATRSPSGLAARSMTASPSRATTRLRRVERSHTRTIPSRPADSTSPSGSRAPDVTGAPCANTATRLARGSAQTATLPSSAGREEPIASRRQRDVGHGAVEADAGDQTTALRPRGDRSVGATFGHDGAEPGGGNGGDRAGPAAISRRTGSAPSDHVRAVPSSLAVSAQRPSAPNRHRSRDHDGRGTATATRP